MERDKLIYLLFSNNERLMSGLAGLRQGMKRQSGEMKLANERSYRFEHRDLVADLIASGRVFSSQEYGIKSQSK